MARHLVWMSMKSKGEVSYKGSCLLSNRIENSLQLVIDIHYIIIIFLLLCTRKIRESNAEHAFKWHLCFKFVHCPAVIGVIWNWSVKPKRAITIPQQSNHFYSTLTSKPACKRHGQGLIAIFLHYLCIFIWRSCHSETGWSWSPFHSPWCFRRSKLLASEVALFLFSHKWIKNTGLIPLIQKSFGTTDSETALLRVSTRSDVIDNDY